MIVYKALTIAGSDSGGGAGIQADLKTFQELDVFGMTALTAVTAQNTLGVHQVYPLTIDAVIEQIRAVGDDLGTDAVKTGMLFSAELIEAVAHEIRQFGWERVVVDPVMVAKGGARLLQEDAVVALREYLIPQAMIITPNLPEAEVLTGSTIHDDEDRKKAARQLYSMGARHVVIKGGHMDDEEQSNDLYYDGERFISLPGKRITTKHTHGTGCTFAAAATAELAKGRTPLEAIRKAKSFVQAAIEYPLAIGKGHGPTNHWAYNRLNRPHQANEE